MLFLKRFMIFTGQQYLKILNRKKALHLLN